MRKQLLALLAGLLLATPIIASAANREGAFSVTPIIGGYTFDGTQHLDTNLVYGGRLGYNFTKAIGIEALMDYVHNTDSTQGSFKGLSMYRFGGEVLYHFIPDSTFVPYVAAGFAGLNFDGDNKRSIHGAVDYGIGAKYFLSDWFALRGDVRHVIYTYGETYNNLEYTVGLHIPFGGVWPDRATVKPVQEPLVSKPAAPPPPKAAVVEAPKPPGATLSVTPVAIIKGESATLSWNSHDATDCTIHPAIGPVQLQGSLRITPGEDTSYTLACQGAGGSAVSKAAHVSVSIPPLPVPVAEPVKKAPPAALPAPPAIKVLFDFNKAAIKPKYHNELKKVGNFLKTQPTAKITIEGHADNIGSKKINQKLSRKRAEKGRSYIIRKFGIKGSRIATKGYASTRPVASNKHKKGRAKNRRIEATARRK